MRFRYRSAGPSTYMVHTDICPSGGQPISASVLIGRVRKGTSSFVNCPRCGYSALSNVLFQLIDAAANVVVSRQFREQTLLQHGVHPVDSLRLAPGLKFAACAHFRPVLRNFFPHGIKPPVLHC